MVDIQRRTLLQLTAMGGFGVRWSWDGRLFQDDGDDESPVEEPDAFDPSIHGFGFPNWAGDTGTGADGEEFAYEPADISIDDVRRRIEDSWSTTLSSVKRDLMTRIVYSWIGGNAATNGHCYGMSGLARDYFENPDELPDEVETASEIPRPADEFNEVGDRIRILQSTQLLRAEPYWFALFGLRWGLSDQRESLEVLSEQIEATETGGIILDGDAGAHQVLASGMEVDDGIAEVRLYDPNYDADSHDGPEGVWTLVVEVDSGDILEIEDGFDAFLHHHAGMDLSAVDRMLGDHQRVVEQLDNAVFLGLETGGTFDIDVPDDVLVDRPSAEYADPEGGPFADAAVVFGDLDEFAFTIEGEPGHEYALSTFGVRGGELVGEHEIEDEIGDVPATIQFSLDEAGDMVVEAVDDLDEEAEEAVNGETNQDDRFVDRWWVPVIGGGLGLGAGYWYHLNRAED